MPSNPHDPDAEIRPLPQCGFGEDIDFNTLIESNHFLFRVYSPKERSPFSDPTDPFFVAPKFDEQFTRSPVDLPDATTVKFPDIMTDSYSEVARHMEWTTRSTSPYLSTSFSFSWSIWEAVRRYHFGVKKDVQIAIIDASALEGRAATAVQLLQNSPPNQRDQQFWKWHRFSHDSQSVLVYGMIPQPAVLASIPILQIFRKMPSYFLRKDVQILDGNPLDQAAWDYTKHKSSYRRFCQHISKLFFSRPDEVRLRDCTAGAVRLALSFLQPFFHRVIQEDFDIGISYLHTFALSISQWPSQSWVNDHPEVSQVVESMVLALGEELREKYYSHQQQEEISRLRLIIDGLQYAIKAQDPHPSRTFLNNVDVDSDGDFEPEESDEPTLVTMDAPSVRKRPSLEMPVSVLPQVPISFQTPITPPESPGRSFFIPTVVVPVSNAITPISIPKFVLHSQDQNVSLRTSSESFDEPSPSPPTLPSHSPVFSSPLVHHVAKSEASVPPNSGSSVMDIQFEVPYDEEGDESLSDSPSIHWNPIAPSSTLSSRRSSITSVDTLCEITEIPSKRFSIASYSSDLFQDTLASPIEIPSTSASFSDPWSIIPALIAPPGVDPSLVPLPPSPSSPATICDLTPSSLLPSPITLQLSLADLESSGNSNTPVIIPPKSRIGLIGPLPLAHDSEGDEDNRRSTTVVETASYIVTGFLVGAFITLFLFSSQRRTLLYLT